MNNLKYIAAISGGPDSMALLDKYRGKIIAVCNVNYKKRVDCDIDQQIVEDYCKKYSIPFFVKIVSKNEYNNNENFQSLARKIRYDFFSKIADKVNCFNLLVAHNLNDHLETAYMKIKKHSKSLFLGIRTISHYKNLTIYRPLLGVKKNELEKYCLDNSIPFAIDSSNSQDIYQRNIVRKIINSWDDKKLSRFNNSINLFNKKWVEVKKFIKNFYSCWDHKNISLLKLSDFLKYYIIYELLRENNINNITFNKINSIIDFLKSKSSKVFILDKNKKMFVKNEVIWIK